MVAVSSMLVAVLCYAIQNVVIARKLSAVHPILLSGIIGTVVVLCDYLVYALRDRFGLVIATPTGKEVAVAAGVGLVLFVAEVSFLNAYFSGGSLAMVTTMVILIPVLASAIQFVLGGGLPHINEFLAYLLAAAAVLLISYVPSTPLS